MSTAYAQNPLLKTENEEWRSAMGFEGVYEVSNHGRARRVEGTNRHPAGHILTASMGRDGYLKVHLSTFHWRGTRKVHVLVCEAFHGPRSLGHVCNHRDAIKTNNHAPNLEWTTQRENARHAHKLGLMVAHDGAKNGRAILTEQGVREIRAVAETMPFSEIASRYGIAISTVSRIVHRKIWKHVD